MKVLLLCTRYPLEQGNSYLTNDLAGAISSLGHEVQVIVLDWSAQPGDPARQLVQPNGVRVLVVAPRSFSGAGWLIEKGTKWILSSFFAMREMRKTIGETRFDLMICFSPLTTVAIQVVWLLHKFKLASYLVQWDFFPYHHRSIGLMSNKFVFATALWCEQFLMRKFDVIGCMSPLNVQYLNANYDIGSKTNVVILPIWGEISSPPKEDKDISRARYALPIERKIVVFGGQITQGRGVEDILAAASLAVKRMPSVVFLIIGEGRLAGLVEAYIAAGGKNVMYRKRIPRDDYLKLVAACDVGLVATVQGVNVPTFPSKLIDYLRAGIPVAAAVEASTDFGTFVEEKGLGRAVEAGDTDALLSAIEVLISEETNISAFSEAGQKCLDEVFDVRIAAKSIINAALKVNRSSLERTGP